MRKKEIDKTLLGIIVVLLLVGLATLASSSFSLSEKKFGTPYYFISRQLFYGLGLGGILFFLGLRIPISFYRRTALLLLLGSIFLIILVFVPGFGIRVGDTSRWLRLGSLSFEPSEVLKFTFVAYLASWMNSKKKEVGTYSQGFIPFLIIIGFVGVFLILEPDIGTLGVLTLTALLLFFMGGGKLSQISTAVLLGIFLLFLLIYLEPYRRDRLLVFLNPEAQRQGSGYQINQALIAIGSGGIFGRGFGLSRQKFQYLPEPAGDAIFAIFAEELGLLGSIFLLALFFIFLIRGMMVAARAKDHFSQLLAAGITLLVIVEVLVNLGAITGIIPLTGIPLPFVSYGGTALALLLFEMGTLLRISRNVS